MVINIGALTEGNYGCVFTDIESVIRAAIGKTVKVIFETCLLTEQQIIDACIISVLAGAHFVKTSTGFSTSGATVSDVRLMKLVVGDACLVKSSGGVRDYETARMLADNGASRIGTSSGVAIIAGEKAAHGGISAALSPTGSAGVAAFSPHAGDKPAHAH